MVLGAELVEGLGVGDAVVGTGRYSMTVPELSPEAVTAVEKVVCVPDVTISVIYPVLRQKCNIPLALANIPADGCPTTIVPENVLR